MIERTAQRSVELFESGLYCAESVLLAIVESRGIQSEWIPKIATGFCGGVSDTCGQCGAVSGAIMGLGLFVGRNTPQETVDRAYTLTRELVTRFRNRFGSTNCFELTGCDLGTAAGQEQFRTKNQFTECKRYAAEATRLALTLLEEKRG